MKLPPVHYAPRGGVPAKAPAGHRNSGGSSGRTGWMTGAQKPLYKQAVSRNLLRPRLSNPAE
jgi:hypothetical protein